jgi:hypothetical protein
MCYIIKLYFSIGTDALRPWGIVQMYCCGFSRLTQTKLKKTLPIIPFFDTSSTNTKDHKHNPPLVEKDEIIPLLQSRIDSLELFLQEYVVDVHYLNDIRDKLIRSRETLNSTIDTMNNLNNQVLQDVRVGFDNVNTNSMYTPVSTTAVQQQQQFPPNFSQNLANSTQQSNTNNISYTYDTIPYDTIPYDVNPRQ